MKKLLTVSLVAVMAVSAAHAKIASTDYVDNTVSPVATKVGSAEFTKGAAAGKTDVTVAIEAVAEAVAGLSGGENSVASQIAAAKEELQDYADGKVKDLADGAVKTNADAIVDMKNAKLQGSLANLIKAEETRATGVESGLNTRIGVLETQGSTAGSDIAQLKLDVVANADAIADNEDAIAAEAATARAAEADNAAAAAANAQAITDMKNADLDGSLANLIKDEETRAKGEEARIEGLVTAEANRADAAEKANAQAIADEKSRAEGVEAGLQTAIDTINDDTNGIFAKAKAYTETAMAKFYANAQECIAESDSHHCIMSAHADASGNPVYVWIDLTAPAE